MESIGAFPEVDWESSLGRMFSSEDLDFTPHFLGQFSFPNYSHNDNIEGMLNLGQPSSICPVISHDQANSESSLFHTLDSLNSNLHFYSQDSSYSSTSAAQENYYISDSCHLPITNDVFLPIFPMDRDNVPAFIDNMIIEETLCNVKEESGNHLQRICNAPELDKTDPESPPNPKKRALVSRVAQKGKKIVESSKKSQENNTDIDGNSTSSYNSEDDNVSQETNGGAISDTTKSSTAVNSNGKARASRGSATDPHSLYARKRRERINERLRILQNLVPNGTKVDLSTMLEEAVHYVKFLQLQIKLLSSDDLWMYAPLAYNGMDIGLNKKFCQLV